MKPKNKPREKLTNIWVEPETKARIKKLAVTLGYTTMIDFMEAFSKMSVKEFIQVEKLARKELDRVSK